MPRLAAFVLAAFLSAALAPAFAQGDDKREALRTFSVTGEGEVAARPDIVILSLSVVTEAKGAAEAFARQRQRAAAVIAAIREAGVEERDIHTSNVSISPRTAYPEGRAPRIEGYAAQNHVQVRIRQIDKAGPVLDSLVTAGVNEVRGISFDFSNRKALLDQARQAAAAEARRKADLYAAALGVRIVGVRSLSEGSLNIPQPVQYRLEQAARPAAPTPIVAGEQDIRMTVSVVFEIAP